MKGRYLYLSIMGVMIFVGLLSVWYFWVTPTPTLFEEGFEHGFGDWVKDADLPFDPNNPGHLVAWNISHVSTISASGHHSLELYIDGRQDDGTIWIEKNLVVNGSSPMHVRVSFDFYSEQESFNVIAGVCAYAGIANPAKEDDFVVLGPANEVAGWKRYIHEATLHPDASGELWVGVGITVRWETEMTYYVDDVTITITRTS